MRHNPSLSSVKGGGVEQSSKAQDLLSIQYETGSLYKLYVHNHFITTSLKWRYYYLPFYIWES